MMFKLFFLNNIFILRNVFNKHKNRTYHYLILTLIKFEILIEYKNQAYTKYRKL